MIDWHFSVVSTEWVFNHNQLWSIYGLIWHMTFPNRSCAHYVNLTFDAIRIPAIRPENQITSKVKVITRNEVKSWTQRSSINKFGLRVAWSKRLPHQTWREHKTSFDKVRIIKVYFQLIKSIKTFNMPFIHPFIIFYVPFLLKLRLKCFCFHFFYRSIFWCALLQSFDSRELIYQRLLCESPGRFFRLTADYIIRLRTNSWQRRVDWGQSSIKFIPMSTAT